MHKSQTQLQLVYPIIHGYSRNQKKQASKSQYKEYSGYIGQRYKKIGDQNPRHFTTRSVYTRHIQISKKYNYNFDPQQSQALIFLKRKWNEQLFQYLSMFGSGYYVKKRSAKDKIKFKQENGFKIKSNPLFRMADLLDKLNYQFVVMKLFHSFQKLIINRNQSLNLMNEDDQKQIQLKEYSIQQATLDDEQLSDEQNQQEILQKSSKLKIVSTKIQPSMNFYDPYKSKDDYYNGRSAQNLFYQLEKKYFSIIKKAHRKCLNTQSIQKIIYQLKMHYRPQNY